MRRGEEEENPRVRDAEDRTGKVDMKLADKKFLVFTVYSTASDTLLR